MATIKYYPAMPSDMMLPPDQSGLLLDHSDTSAEFTTRAYGDTIVLTGQNFIYQNDALVGGTATEFVYRAGGSMDYYRITDFAVDLSLGVPTGWPSLFGGDDTIVGSYARDFLSGEAGDDFIRGGKGEDHLIGGAGDDILKGGGRSDTFVFSLSDGIDTIVDFNTSRPNRDVLFIHDVEELSELKVSQSGSDVIIEFSPENKIILQQVDLHDLSPRNFNFD